VRYSGSARKRQHFSRCWVPRSRNQPDRAHRDEIRPNHFLRGGLLVASIAVALVGSPRTATWVAQAILGALVVASFTWVGHGIYDSCLSGILHTGADVPHLLAAGVWIGAFVPLRVLIMRSLKTRSEGDAYAALEGLERFSGIGPAAVSILFATGLINSWFLVAIGNGECCSQRITA